MKKNIILWMATDSNNKTYLYKNEPTKGEKYFNLKTSQPYLYIGDNVHDQIFKDGARQVEIDLKEEQLNISKATLKQLVKMGEKVNVVQKKNETIEGFRERIIQVSNIQG